MEEDFPDTLPADSFEGFEDEGGRDAAAPSAGENPADDFPETLSAQDFHTQANQDDFPDTIDPEEFEKSHATSSRSGVFARGAAEGALPAVGSMAAGVATGAAIGTAFAPGPGTAAGAIGGGLMVAVGANWLLQKGQDWVLDKLGMRDDPNSNFNREQQATDEAQYPYTRFAGNMAPALATLSPSGSLAQRAISGGIGGAFEAGSEFVNEGHVDPAKVAMATAGGAAFPSLNRAGQTFENAGNRAGQAFRGQQPGPTTGTASGQGPNGPQPGPQSGPQPLNGTVTPPPSAPPNPDAVFARAQRDSFATGDPMWNFWNDHMEATMRGETGRPDIDVDASMGPHGDMTGFTYHDSDRANDVTTTAIGVAAENPPTPQVAGAGNPVGSPMAQRVAARPRSELRDYAKDRQALSAPEATQQSTKVSSAPIHEDVMAALHGEEPIPDVPRDPSLAHPVEQLSGTMGRMDPVEASQLHRDATARALDDVRQRNRTGEDAETPLGPLNPDRPAAPTRLEAPTSPAVAGERRVLPDLTAPGEKLTAPVTDAQKATLVEVRQKLKENGMTRVLARLDQFPEHAQIKAAEQLLDSIKGEHAKEKEAEGRHRLKTGVQTGGGARATRKEGALEAAERAVAQYGGEGDTAHIPVSVKDRNALVERLQKMFDHAKELNGGEDPTESYKPRVKPAAWQTLRNARKVIANPTPANIREYFAAEKALREGGAGAASDFQQTKRIEADIELKPQIESTAAEAMTAAQEAPRSRVEYPEFNNASGDESVIYARQQDDLRSWLNNLSDETHERLAEIHDIDGDLAGTHDPAALKQQYLNDLTRDTKSPAPTVREPSVRTPVRTRAEVDRFAPTDLEKPASTGKVLAKNSPEFKAAAEAALKRSAPNREAELAHAESIQAENRAAGTWKEVADKFHDFIGDEGGAVRIPTWLKQGWWTPSPNAAVREAADHFTHEFHINAGTITNMDTKLAAHFAAQTKSPLAFRERVYNRMEEGRPLSQREQAYYDQNVQPLKDWHARVYDAWRRLDPSLPPPFAGVSARHVPRMAFPEARPRGANMEPWRQNLSDWAGSLEDRTLKALDDGAGGRVVFHYDPDTGTGTILRRGAPQKLNVPSGFTGDLGQTITFNVNRKPRTFTVDHATTSEIEQNVPGTRFIKDPVVAYSNAIRGMQTALIKRNMLDRLKSDQRVIDNSTTDKAEARRRGFDLEPTILKEMSERNNRPLYLAKRLKWSFDDFAKPGLNDSDLDPLRRFANTAAKPLYITSPFFHVLNVADNWAHAMNVSLLNVPRVFNEGLRAIKEVMTQGPMAREFQAAGGRLMYPTQLLDGGVINQIIQKAGYQLAKNPSIFDPITKATGMDIPEIMHNAMVKSNKIMWAGNDMFALSLYQRNRRLGMSPQDAVKATHDWIGNYASDSPTFAGSRILQKIVNDPAVSWFGRYHQDLWRSYGKIIQGLLPATGATPQQRKDAVGALVLSGILMFGVYPHILDKAAEFVTGNEKAEFGRRGMTALPDAALRLYQGDKDYVGLARNVFTPSIPANMFFQAVQNTTWDRKQIVPEAPLYEPKQLLKAGARITDWAASSAIPPWSTVSRELAKPGASLDERLWGAGKKFMESTIGIKDPSEAAQRFETQREKFQHREERRRTRKPGGVLENLVND